jgi:hypothetical protein
MPDPERQEDDMAAFQKGDRVRRTHNGDDRGTVIKTTEDPGQIIATQGQVLVKWDGGGTEDVDPRTLSIE